MKNKGILKILFIIILIISLTSISLFYYKEQNISLDNVLAYTENDPISFNYTSGFYTNDIDIEITKSVELSSDVEIYYTLNGDDPTKANSLYDSPIHLSIIDDETKVYPLKVILYVNGSYSKIYEEDYVLSTDDSYDLPIISITSDWSNLYDYETGIMVDGASYDQGLDIQNYQQRGEDWLRSGNFEYIEKNGSRIINKKVDISISGGRSEDNKSIKITAINNEKIPNYFFDNEVNNTSIINNYDKLLVRMGSQDYDNGNVRTSLGYDLSNQSNYYGDANTTRVIVYLNGSFYGIGNLIESYTKSNIAKKYSLDKNININEFKDNQEKILLQQMGISDLFENDLNIKSNRDSLEESFDMDDYLTYYAIELLMNNVDWPWKNCEIWNYTGKYNSSNKYTDGRYRYLIYDLDLTYYTEEYELWDGVGNDKLVTLLKDKSSSYFSNVMESDYYRNKFLIIMKDLLNTSFKIDNIEGLIDEEYSKIKDSVYKFYDNDYISNSDKSINILKDNVIEINDRINNHFTDIFGLTDKYHVSIEASDGAQISWNNMNVYANDAYENDYYVGTYPTLTLTPYVGYRNIGFNINGKDYYVNSIELTEDMIEDGNITIKAITQKAKDASLIISEFSADGDSDWYKIKSISDDINLNNYYLSDDSSNLTKYRLPNITLNSGETIKINGKKNYYALGNYICNFNLNNTETLYLTDGTNIIDEVPVPRMNSSETYGRYLDSNTFVYYNNLNGQRISSNY